MSLALPPATPAVAAISETAPALCEPKRPGALDVALRSSSNNNRRHSIFTGLALVFALVLSQQPHALQLLEQALGCCADSWRDFDFFVPLPLLQM